MGSYSISFKNSIEKDLRKIPRELLPHIFEHIEKLSADPLPHDVQKLAVRNRCTGSGLEITGLFTRCFTNPIK
jgi:mRNA-degrading endonuclease RelE of RelBE toxin-antitoxin system